MGKPNIFLIGAAKAGSTSLYNYLIKHEEIYANIKEPWYFTDRKGLTNGNKVKGEDSYEKLYKSDKNYKYYMDASPSYLCFPEVAKDIYEYNNDAKIIIILRNPIDRIKSYYRMYYKAGFDGSLSEFLEYKDTFLPIKEAGLYSEQVKEYKNIFKNNVLVIIFEEMIKNPNKVKLELENFLKLGNINMDIKNKYNTTYKPKNIFFDYLFFKNNFLKKIFRIFVKSYNTKGRIKNYLYSLGTSQEKYKGKIDKETESYLKEYYYNDIKKLEKLLNINLDSWY